MKANKEHNKCGIYCIRNIINNKVYIGKSKNIYRRIIEHKNRIKVENKDENPYLIKSVKKYGINNFEYFVLEFLEENENLVSERELYWMKIYNSLNKNFGYNLRSDSSTKMIIHEKTSKKISERLKKEWSKGLRKDHSKKLSDNWKLTPERNKKQSLLMSKNKTKYKYLLYDLNNIFIEECDYKKLVEIGLKSVLSNFSRHKINSVKCKSYIIVRVKIEDIVRSSEKSEKN